MLQDINFQVKAGERVGVGPYISASLVRTTLILLCSWSYWIRKIYPDFGDPALHIHQGLCNFRWLAYSYHQFRCPSLKCYHHSSSGEFLVYVVFFLATKLYFCQPELLNGSLRHNLDVSGQYDDTTLNDALRAAGLFSVQHVSDENRITLDTEVTSGGKNFSLGQRQIIALARAIVRQSKLLILDEATSAIGESFVLLRPTLRDSHQGRLRDRRCYSSLTSHGVEE